MLKPHQSLRIPSGVGYGEAGGNVLGHLAGGQRTVTHMAIGRMPAGCTMQSLLALETFPTPHLFLRFLLFTSLPVGFPVSSITQRSKSEYDFYRELLSDIS